MDLGAHPMAAAGRLLVGAAAFATALAFGQSRSSSPDPLPLPESRGAAPAPPAPENAPARNSSGRIGPVKLRNESIDQVLDLLEHWTGKTLLRPSALPTGTYNLTLDDAVSRDEAVMAIETLLNLNGVAVTPL